MPAANRARGVDLQARKAANYATIKAEVLEAVANLPGSKKMWIPLDGTLPEIMVGLGLVLLGLTFESQTSAGGGRLYEGGSVIDFKVSLGAQPIAVRVQGDYWHTKGDRESKDAVQFDRLHAEGFLVADVWEADIYEAWLQGGWRASWKMRFCRRRDLLLDSL